LKRLNLANATLALLLLASACSTDTRHAHEAAAGPTPAAASLSRDERVEIFEQVWQIINDDYYDPAFNGVNWRDVHTRYLPRAESAKTDDEFYRLFEQMLAELRDAHTTFSRARPDESKADGQTINGSVGISLAEAGGRVVIATVEPDSDAARAGVEPGMRLLSVNARPVEELFAEIRSQFAGSSSERAMKSVMRGALLYGGFLGTSRTFGVEAFDGRTFDFEVKRRSARTPSPALDARRLASGYGYIKFDSWEKPVGEKFKAALDDLIDTRGLLIDLRGNGGGSGEVLQQIASIFFARVTHSGSFRTRAGGLEKYYTLKPDKVYKGAVVILVDENSASASETFTAFMQESGRAAVVGRQTCGCALNSYTRKIKGGGTLRFSARLYISPNGRVLEGAGVSPDEEVPLTVSDLRRGRDAALEAGERRLSSLTR
jgi:carboxyl-terminal processing protease